MEPIETPIAFVAAGRGWQGGREHRSERARMPVSEERTGQRGQRRPGVTAVDRRQESTRLRSWGETSEASANIIACESSLQPGIARGPDVPRSGTARDRQISIRGRIDRTLGDPPGSWSSPPTPTTPISGRPRPRRAGSTRAPSAGSCAARAATPAARTPTRDPLELAAEREREQRAAADDRRLRGRDVPPPARRRPRQRPRAARAARPRDPDVPARRGPRDRPGRRLLPRRRRQPHRPSGRRDGRGRRRLPGGAQPDGVPVARPSPAWTRTSSGGSTSSGRTSRPPASTYRDARPQDRRAARARRARSTSRRSSTQRIREWAAEEGEADRRRRRPRRSGSWSSRTTRKRVRPATPPRASGRRRGRRAMARGQRRLSPPTSSSGRTSPHSFQSSARPSARRPSSETSSPSVRPPAASQTYSSAATVDVARAGPASRPPIGQRRIRIGSRPA